jgi:two-component system, OmpR family, copper resistance phosphate regulon response regulator CusR
LEETGFVMEQSRNGLDGYHMTVCEVIDLLILDEMIPDIDGWQILQTL